MRITLQPRFAGFMALAPVAALLSVDTALACGGFFCSREPMDQAAERIVFAVDEQEGIVDAHVQITYEGSAEDFAWVVPVPAEPELFLSTDQLFTEIGWRMQPQFYLNYLEEGDCSYGGYGYSSAEDAASSWTSTVSDYDYDGGVIVVDQATVGPYETVTLQANSSEALIDWLQANDYDLPDDLDPVLAPYVAPTTYFVALRLSNDRTAGDIAPLGMRYAGDKAGIPIQLTSIAAVPDIRLEVYVFGSKRAVPSNYLHVQINEAAIDWMGNGSNYEQVITLAANEAGGHAFATDFAGSTSSLSMDGVLHADGRYDTESLKSKTDPVEFMDSVISQGFPANETLMNLLRFHIPMPPEVESMGVDDSDFYNCLECYHEYLDDIDFDPVALANDLEEFVVEPLRQAQALFTDHTWVSRLTSSLDADEMTVDPIFVFNPDMGEVPNVHWADLVTMCGLGGNWYDSMRRLELTDGRSILLPSQEWLDENGMTLMEFMAELAQINAQIIEETGESGAPSILFDYTGDLADQADAWNDSVLDLVGEADEEVKLQGDGCGCDVTGPAGAGWILALGLLAGQRRRRRAA